MPLAFKSRPVDKAGRPNSVRLDTRGWRWELEEFHPFRPREIDEVERKARALEIPMAKPDLSSLLLRNSMS